MGQAVARFCLEAGRTAEMDDAAVGKVFVRRGDQPVGRVSLQGCRRTAFKVRVNNVAAAHPENNRHDFALMMRGQRGHFRHFRQLLEISRRKILNPRHLVPRHRVLIEPLPKREVRAEIYLFETAMLKTFSDRPAMILREANGPGFAVDQVVGLEGATDLKRARQNFRRRGGERIGHKRDAHKFRRA